jgi:enoyl-CoA hydratase/carnithine racemase
MPENIKLEIRNRIARIEFSRAPLNMFDLTMVRQFHSAIEELHNQRGICGVLLQATPDSKIFSAGIEFSEYQGVMAWQVVQTFYDCFRLLDEISKPIVIAVDGPALSGGCELVLLGDIVIASERSVFAFPEIRAGLFPIFASMHLPPIIGRVRASEIIFTGTQINARTAAAWGLINHVVAPESFSAKLDEVLTGLRAMSASSLELARRAQRPYSAHEFREMLERTERLFLEQLLSTEDAQEGVRAAIEKRRPNWSDK